jgi:hypothetical protein
MKLDQDELDAIAAYLKNDGSVTVCPAGEVTDPELISHVWTKNKAGRPPAAARKPDEESDA